MSGIHGAKRLQTLSAKLSHSLQEHSAETFPPDAQKTLRSYSMREVADFLGVNQNTFRHYLKIYEGRIPTGNIVHSNRRYFSVEEMMAIRDLLWTEKKLTIKEFRRRQPGEAMKVLTTFNLKGGVSKTSTAVHVAQALALRGYRVLAVDLDAQASLTNLFGLSPEHDPDMLTSYNVITYDKTVPIKDAIRKTYFPGIDLLPASMMIIEFEYETALSFRSRSAAPFHTRMAAALEQVKDDYDIVIFDTPPQMSFAVISAIFASTGLIIPLTASMLDVMSLASFLRMASGLMDTVEGAGAPKKFDFIRFLITRFESTDQPQIQVASYLRTVLGDSVLSAEFVKSTAIGDAANTKQPVFEVEPREMNKKTYDRVVESINRIVDEIEDDLNRAWGRN